MRSEKFIRTPAFSRLKMLVLLLGLLSTLPAAEKSGSLTGAELDSMGKRIWQNECDGTVDGLTSWNTGENFASLGIGHFIWLPEGVDERFEESFPKLLAFMKAEGIALPKWLLEAKHCPWPDKKTFDAEHNTARQKELRQLLSTHIRVQVRCIIHRLDEATPKYRAAAGKAAKHVEAAIAALRQSAAGSFALIDYVNFKGDGLNPRERYHDEGWGLLQVLMEMKPATTAEAPAAFAEAARRVLERRVKNSPPERGEARWLKGWKNRCERYRA